MKDRTRYTATHEELRYKRWKDGWSPHQIAKLFGREVGSVRSIMVQTGGIQTPANRRSAIALTLTGSVETSPALTFGQSIRSIAYVRQFTLPARRHKTVLAPMAGSSSARMRP